MKQQDISILALAVGDINNPKAKELETVHIFTDLAFPCGDGQIEKIIEE